MVTMLLGGLWHGASWTFVVWGGVHGTGLALERWRRDRAGAVVKEPGSARVWMQRLVTVEIGLLRLDLLPLRLAARAWEIVGGLFTGWARHRRS